VDKSNHERTAAEEGSFSLLKMLAEASAVFVALTFLAGWSYLASYYKTFGLNPIELDVPVPVVSTIALHMLYDSVWPLPVLAMILVVLAAVAHRFGHRRGSRQGWVVAGLIFVMFFTAIAALFRGRHVANLDMLEESSSLPLVAFSSKSEAAKIGPPDQPSCVAFQTFGGMDCKLLLHSKEVYYFFRPIPKSLAEGTDKLDLYMIPDSDVLGIHIQRGVDLSQVQK
jgi:hypothetical protein